MIRVFIVSGVRLYRDGLAQYLGGAEDVDVVGMAASAEAATTAITHLAPDVVLLNAARPEGAAAARTLAERFPALPIVALAVPTAGSDVVAWAEAGVSAFVTTDESLEDMVAAIKSAVRGEAALPPRLATTLLRRISTLSRERRAHDDSHNLTRRELEIARLIERGFSNKEIAQRLCIEVATVKNHVHNVLEKLRVRRRAEAAAWVRANGFVHDAPTHAHATSD